MFVKNAERNFRAADVKKIAEKRRLRLDKEHGVDREMHKDAFIALDQMYRISEKAEIKKYQEIGKSAQDYYKDKEGRDKLDAGVDAALAADNDKDLATATFKETLLNRDEKEGIDVKLIERDGYEQV
jgi:hypothetical protein